MTIIAIIFIVSYTYIRTYRTGLSAQNSNAPCTISSVCLQSDSDAIVLLSGGNMSYCADKILRNSNRMLNCFTFPLLDCKRCRYTNWAGGWNGKCEMNLYSLYVLYHSNVHTLTHATLRNYLSFIFVLQ